MKERERRQIVENVSMNLMELDAMDQVLQSLAQENVAARSSSSTSVVYLTQFDLDRKSDWERFLELFLYRPEDHPSQGEGVPVPPFMEAAQSPDAEMELSAFSGMLEQFGGEFPDEFERLSTFHRPDRKISRNETCPCGSGKKYKRCCGRN